MVPFFGIFLYHPNLFNLVVECTRHFHRSSKPNGYFRLDFPPIFSFSSLRFFVLFPIGVFFLTGKYDLVWKHGDDGLFSSALHLWVSYT